MEVWSGFTCSFSSSISISTVPSSLSFILSICKWQRSEWKAFRILMYVPRYVPATWESIGNWNSCKMLLIFERTIIKVVRWRRGGRRSAQKIFVQGKILWKKIHASQVAPKNRLDWLKKDSCKTNVTEKKSSRSSLFPTSSKTFLMVRPLKDNKATFSQAVNFSQ